MGMKCHAEGHNTTPRVRITHDLVIRSLNLSTELWVLPQLLLVTMIWPCPSSDGTLMANSSKVTMEPYNFGSKFHVLSLHQQHQIDVFSGIKYFQGYWNRLFLPFEFFAQCITTLVSCKISIKFFHLFKAAILTQYYQCHISFPLHQLLNSVLKMQFPVLNDNFNLSTSKFCFWSCVCIYFVNQNYTLFSS